VNAKLEMGGGGGRPSTGSDCSSASMNETHQPGACLYRHTELQGRAFTQLEQLHALAIQPDLELMRPAGPSS
jgi:hypothetical protein